MVISLGAPRSSQHSPAVAIVRKLRKIAIFATTRRTGQCCAVVGTGRAPSVHSCHYYTPCPFCKTATRPNLSRFHKIVKHAVKHRCQRHHPHTPQLHTRRRFNQRTHPYLSLVTLCYKPPKTPYIMLTIFMTRTTLKLTRTSMRNITERTE